MSDAPMRQAGLMRQFPEHRSPPTVSKPVVPLGKSPSIVLRNLPDRGIVSRGELPIIEEFKSWWLRGGNSLDLDHGGGQRACQFVCRLFVGDKKPSDTHVTQMPPKPPSTTNSLEIRGKVSAFRCRCLIETFGVPRPAKNACASSSICNACTPGC